MIIRLGEVDYTNTQYHLGYQKLVRSVLGRVLCGWGSVDWQQMAGFKCCKSSRLGAGSVKSRWPKVWSGCTLQVARVERMTEPPGPLARAVAGTVVLGVAVVELMPSPDAGVVRNRHCAGVFRP